MQLIFPVKISKGSAESVVGMEEKRLSLSDAVGLELSSAITLFKKLPQKLLMKVSCNFRGICHRHI